MRIVSDPRKGIAVQRGGGRHQLGSGFRNVFRSILAKVVPYAIRGIKSIRSVEACKECINEIQKVAVDQGMKAVNKAIKRTANKIVEQHESAKKKKEDSTVSDNVDTKTNGNTKVKKGKGSQAQANKKNKKKKKKQSGAGIF